MYILVLWLVGQIFSLHSTGISYRVTFMDASALRAVASCHYHSVPVLLCSSLYSYRYRHPAFPLPPYHLVFCPFVYHCHGSPYLRFAPPPRSWTFLGHCPTPPTVLSTTRPTTATPPPRCVAAPDLHSPPPLPGTTPRSYLPQPHTFHRFIVCHGTVPTFALAFNMPPTWTTCRHSAFPMFCYARLTPSLGHVILLTLLAAAMT